MQDNGRLAGSWNYRKGMRASASTGGEGLNQRRSHLRTGARVCNDVRGPTRIWTLLVAKFASRRRHNLGDPLLKEAASTCFGGPLILVVMVIGSETEQLRFRGNFSEVAASVLEWSFRLIYNRRKDHFRTEAFIFCQPSITFSKKSSVPTLPPSHGGLKVIFKNIENLNIASTRDRS